MRKEVDCSVKSRKLKVGIIIAIVVLAILSAPYSAVCIYLSNDAISGFVGVPAAARMMITGERYVKLSNRPLRYLVKNGSVTEFYEKIGGDTSNSSDYVASAMLDGVRYHYSTRCFTYKFTVVIFETWDKYCDSCGLYPVNANIFVKSESGDILLDKNDFAWAYMSYNRQTGLYGISLTTNMHAPEKTMEVTQDPVDQEVDIYLDDELLVSTRAITPIMGSEITFDSLSEQEASEICEKIKGG